MSTGQVTGVSVLLAAALAAFATSPQPGIRRAELQRHDLAVPGREVVQVRVEFDRGAAFGSHWHPGEELVYVLEGSLRYDVQGSAPVTLGPGDVLFIPARSVHAARNVGGGEGVELATYIMEKGEPLVVMVESATGVVVPSAR